MTRQQKARVEASLFYGICSKDGFESEGEIAVKLGWTPGNDISEPENSEYNIQQDVRNKLNVNGISLDRAGSNKYYVPYFWAVRIDASDHTIVDTSILLKPSKRQEKLLKELSTKLGWSAPGWKLATYR